METTGGRPQPDTDLIGVYRPDQDLAVRAALAELRIPPERVHVGAPGDERTALRAEQVEESERSIVAPQAGIVIPETAAKAMGWTMPVFGAIGALLGALLALVPMGSTSFGTRLLWFGLLGIAGGLTVAFVVTGAMASKDPYVASEAQRGFVVRVEGASSEAAERLASLHPIRLDRVDRNGEVLQVVANEEDERPGGALEELERNVEREANASPTDRHR